MRAPTSVTPRPIYCSPEFHTLGERLGFEGTRFISHSSHPLPNIVGPLETAETHIFTVSGP